MFFLKTMRARHASDDVSGEIPKREPSSTMQHARRFGENRAGNVSIIFGLIMFPFLSFAGISVDFAKATREKSKIQTALDTAALSAGRTFQVSGSEAEAKAAAALYFKKLTGYDLTINSVDPGTFVLTVGSQEDVTTSFMSLMGDQYRSLTVNAVSKAQLVREQQGDEVEVAMMLDITGSMGGQRIADLKVAASDLVNILVNDGEDEVRVALAPFSHAVNVGSYFNAMTNTNDNNGNGGNCVVERTGNKKYKDHPPSNNNKYFRSLNAGRTDEGLTSNYWRCPSAPIVPLTSDKSLLLDEINDLPTHGNTAGHLGTAWAWYLVSKRWSNMFPSNRAPKSNLNGVKKIVVLMSDGRYNRQWFNDNHDSDEQARRICNQMKKATNGVEVYSVGFGLTEGSDPYKRLEACASEDSGGIKHFFPAATGEELKSAFRAIAFNIAQLRLIE